MPSDNISKKKSDGANFDNAWAKQWSDTTEERAKKQAEGKAKYDAIIDKKKQSDQDDR
jgi:hypothetical protein